MGRQADNSSLYEDPYKINCHCMVAMSTQFLCRSFWLLADGQPTLIYLVGNSVTLQKRGFRPWYWPKTGSPCHAAYFLSQVHLIYL